MRKAVIIFGPHAVGKMTVGQEVERRTDLRLFHNHMSIEPFLELFKDMPAERSQITDSVRNVVFELFAKSDQEGLIFTFIWYFDDPEHEKEIDRLEKLFNEHGTEVYFVELEADINTRLERNITENRLTHKASKRDIDFSVGLINEKESKHRVNSKPGEISRKHYIRINNTNIDPSTVAEMVVSEFNL
jgi:hypothetical protein